MGPSPTVSASDDEAQGASPAAATSRTITELAAQTATQAAAGASRFQIALHPADLGQVTIVVKIDADGSMSAAFTSDRPDTTDALSARSGELQKALEDAGFSVAPAGLSFSSAHTATAAADQIASSVTPSSASNPQQGAGQNASQNGDQGSSQTWTLPGGQLNSHTSGQSSSGQAFSQASGQGLSHGFGQNSGQSSGQNAGQQQPGSHLADNRGRAFATGAETTSAADRTGRSAYAQAAQRGVDIRI